MPRIRTIKPEFWTDEKILRISRDARLLFIALWNFADDNGVVEYKPLQIKAQIFPIDNDIGPEEIQILIEELQSIGLISTYQIQDKRYLWIKKFRQHQKIDRPRKSNLPLPPNDQNVQFIKSHVISNDCKNLQTTSDDFSRNQMKSTEIITGMEKGIERETPPPPLTRGAYTHVTQKPAKEQNMQPTRNQVISDSSNTISDDFSRNQMKSTEIIPGREKEGIGNRKGIGREGKDKELRSAKALRVVTADAVTTPGEPEPEKFSSQQNTEGVNCKTTLSNKLPLCPIQEIVQLYHETLPELPRCKVLSEKRKALIRTRWREVLSKPEIMVILVQSANGDSRENGLRWFERYFHHVSKSDFLTGRVPPSNGRDRPFIADLEWLMRPNNFAKVIEGKYHADSRASPLSQLSDAGRKTAMAAMSLMRELEQEEMNEMDQ